MSGTAQQYPPARALVEGRSLLVWVAVACGLAWRLWLTTRYAGWEESDYGNLAMVQGVLDGGFRHYDMNHMPGYYALAAMVFAVVEDAVLAARATSMVGGVVALGLSVWLADRVFGRRVAIAAAVLLVVQPEFALYAASSLREPVYAAFVLGALAALCSERLVLAGVLAGCAFLVRFDAVLAVGPALLLHAAGRRPRHSRLLRVALPVAAAVVGWAAYCRVDHGTWMYWSHAVDVNVETGLGGEATTRLDWLVRGGEVVSGLLGRLLPWRIGWGTWLGLGLAVVITDWRRPGPARTWIVLALGMSGVWAGMGLVAQHSPEHNLYWKWLCPLIPVLLPLGLRGLDRVAGALGSVGGRWTPVLLLALAVAQAGASNLKETRRQLRLSDDLYRPQLDLGRWFEAEVPEHVPLLVDNIPRCWLDRRHHERRITSWFDVPSTPGDPASFARWLAGKHIGWVLWFREDWTQAPVVAPFLAGGGTWSEGAVQLTETGREDGYGWILYRVTISAP